MYDENQFPIDTNVVQNDHLLLNEDLISALFRRINTLNRCARMKLADYSQKKSQKKEDSGDEEEQYALSENWQFERSSRRWSRISGAPEQPESVKQFNCHTLPERKHRAPEEIYCSSHDSVFADEHHSSPDSSAPKPDRFSASPSQMGDFSPVSSSGSGGTLSLTSEDIHEHKPIRRTGSDRVKERSKALLKRMESLKGRKKKKAKESKKMENTIHDSGSSSSSLTSSPQLQRSERIPNAILDGSFRMNMCHDASSSKHGAHSDSECHAISVSDKNLSKQSKSSLTTITVTSEPTDTLTPTFNQSSNHTDISLNQLHPNSVFPRFKCHDKRNSFYDNLTAVIPATAPIVVFNEFCTQSLDENPEFNCDSNSATSNGKVQSPETQNEGEIIVISRRDSGVGSSLTRVVYCPYPVWHCFPTHFVPVVNNRCAMRITDLTASQIALLKKLCLLKLTTLMEKFSPSSKTGWSWGVQKFIQRMRNPDYKDKIVFGVPLLLVLQRTGKPLPVSIQCAFKYLRTSAMDQIGLFRKPGVRTRIECLRTLHESNADNIVYKEEQAFDVADMLKQYFRELPEALFTNKLSETLIGIFQFIPEDLRLEAIQAALILMPDENREVLQMLLEFLSELAENSNINQMTATNLAVCFAPSLFNFSFSGSPSPRRRKTVSVPENKELNEAKAAYQCLSVMISNYSLLFSVSEEMVFQSRILSATHSEAVSLDDMNSGFFAGHSGISSYIDNCVQMVFKDVKEKFRNSQDFSKIDRIEVSNKKLVDGYPLRFWKVSTEVEAPPLELLHRIIRERHLWDPSCSRSRVISRLSNNTDVVQYTNSSLSPHPSCDYVVLRSWRTDLPKGACVLIETSVNHPDAVPSPNSVRALVLASRYLIEPCGSGKSRITHLSRVDTRGRSCEWYNRAYGHICARLMTNVKKSFSHTHTGCVSVGPETKV